jgi:nitrite reductase (NO-forming)
MDKNKEHKISGESFHKRISKVWPATATGGVRVAFGIIWAISAALAWEPSFAQHYVGYLHNAVQGQPGWLVGWFNMWISIVTPHTMLFVWITRVIETVIALALLTGLARKSIYIVGIIFSLLIWSTAGGFGGPYTVGATNMGSALAYVLIFAALIGLDTRGGRSPYSLDYFIERRWPSWYRFAEWGGKTSLSRQPEILSWRFQIPAILGIILVLIFLIGGLHSSFNVKSPTPDAAAAAVEPLTLATDNSGGFHDASLPQLLNNGESVNIQMIAKDDTVTIANGVTYNAWTFNGSVPAPTIHVRQGQTVNITFTNEGNMMHGLDFHAAQVAPSLHFKDIRPGKTIQFSFVAEVPGAFMYHCSTAPVLMHIGNGMYGALIVDPARPLPPADKSYVLVQSEWYTRQISGNLMGQDYSKMLAEKPDEVVFNGVAFQYRDHPLQARVGERVRIYLVNAGPNLWTSFHVIGAIFDKVYPDGDQTHALSGVSTYTVGPGGGAVFDVIFKESGKYTFVDHDMAHMTIGAQGVFNVQ